MLRDDPNKLSGENRCVTALITAAQETISALLPALSEGLSPGFHYQINIILPFSHIHEVNCFSIKSTSD